VPLLPPSTHLQEREIGAELMHPPTGALSTYFDTELFAGCLYSPGTCGQAVVAGQYIKDNAVRIGVVFSEKRGELPFAKVAIVKLAGAMLVSPLPFADGVGALALRAICGWFRFMHTFRGLVAVESCSEVSGTWLPGAILGWVAL